MAKPTKNAKGAKQTSDEFISEGALGGESAYLNIKKEKESEFRIISKPIEGWLEWVDKKPIRTPLDDGKPEATDEENPPKKFIAMVVIDSVDDEPKILELTQQSVIKAIRALAQNPKWGNPFSYNISVVKTGEGLQSRYTVTPSPKSVLSKDIVKNAMEKPCNLEKLFEGENPWEVGEKDEKTEYHFK